MRPRSASYTNPADLLGGSFGFSLDLSPTPRVPPAPGRKRKGPKKKGKKAGREERNAGRKEGEESGKKGTGQPTDGG
jgi:hypothetical protein